MNFYCTFFKVNYIPIFDYRNGPEWWRIRQAAQKALSTPNNVRRYLPVTDETVREFLSQIPHETDDFLPLLSYLNLECKYIVLVFNIFFILYLKSKCFSLNIRLNDFRLVGKIL